METFDVAHIRQQGVDLIIIPVKSTFGTQIPQEQQRICSYLQRAATSAGLAGTVVPVWDSGFGRMSFWAPRNWHPFFKSIDLNFVGMNINRKLTCF